MNYLKHYTALMRTATNRKEIPEINEKHHIYPVSIYGKNDTIVVLSIREHLIAHLLLWKVCEKRYGKDHWKTKKMCFAASQMGWTRVCGERVNSIVLSSARKRMAVFLTGNNNPSKKPENRKKISQSKLGVSRPDMCGKQYFGADTEKKREIISKMIISKTGKKINYPKNRVSPPCSNEKALKISESRKNTKQKYKEMTESEFDSWLAGKSKFNKNGRKNPNITRALQYRNIDVEQYYMELTK